MREIDVREIRAFFDRYRDAFDRLDGDAVARCFAIPCGILTGGVYVHWPTFEAIHSNMRALCAQYRSQGYAAAHYEIAWSAALGPEACVVDLAWTVERHGGEPWRFHTAYNLTRDSGGWCILLCTAYEEQLSS